MLSETLNKMTSNSDAGEQIDRLDSLFAMQTKLMTHLRETDPAEVPEWPIDLSDRKAQRACRDFALRATEELFEAVLMLKKWKGHRVIDQNQLDRDGFIEEIVDALHYVIEVLILTGVSSSDLHSAFVKKHAINMQRINTLREELLKRVVS
jgi:hypothetical protein